MSIRAFAIFLALFPALCIAFRLQTPRRAGRLNLMLSTSVVDKDVRWNIDSWRKGYATCKKETAEAMPGVFPKDLEGTYFRNGFGKFTSGSTPILHPFDADGMIAAVTIKDGAGTFRNSFVRTKGFNRERKTRRMAGRGCFGNHKYPGPLGNAMSLGLKNVANTNVMYWGGRLLALWEGGLPYRMDPESLRTFGEYTFRGLLKKGDALTGGFLKKGESITAHPRVDPVNDRLVSFSLKADPKESTVTVFEFDRSLSPVGQRSFNVEGMGFFHDFVVTKNYYIFNAAPVDFDPVPFALGKKAPAQCIKYRPERPSVLYLVPRDPTQPVETVPIESHFNFHYANAYEEEDTGRIVFDIVWAKNMVLGSAEEDTADTKPIWQTIDFAEEVPFTTLQRYTLIPNSSGGENGLLKKTWSYSRTQLSDTSMDFTSVNPKVSTQKHRYIFGLYGYDPNRASPPQGLIKLDTVQGTETRWNAGPDAYLGEPVFAPKKFDENNPATAPANRAEDDGYIVTFLSNFNEEKTEFVVFDAKDITKGPIYREPVPVMLPHGLHGTYVNGLTWPQDEIIQRFKAWTALDKRTWNEVKSGFSGLGISYDF